MNLKKILLPVALTAATAGFSFSAQAEVATETRYPVIFAHGMAGWDSLGGYSYFGEDYWGTFVGDACGWFEMNGCNDWISTGQQSNNKAEAFQVTSLHNSEVRGEELYNHIRSFMASTGYSKVNLTGHSQGGFDIRKAAHRLKDYYGVTKVGTMISISSPHRGSSYAKTILDMYSRNSSNVFCGALPANPDGSDPCLAYVTQIADVLFDFATGANTSSNNIIAAGLQLVYNDYDANDGKTTGAKAFNINYPGTTAAGYVASIITGQDNGDLSPLLAGLGAAANNHNADGDGYCVDDCDNDGAAGMGDGTVYDMDDDGLVPINSQQMGYRLQYTANDWTCAWYGCWDPLDKLTQVSDTGYVTNINAPSSIQMTSHVGKLSQDHLDVISLGPDTLDEEEFYAALFQRVYDAGY